MRAKGAPALRDSTVRRARVAIALSLLLHALFLLFVFRIRPPLDRPRPQPTQLETIVIRDEHKVPKKKPIAIRPVAVVPRKKPLTPPVVSAAPAHRRPVPSQPVPRSIAVPHELAKVAPHAKPHPPKPIETGAPNSAGVAATKPQLSGRRIAQIEDDLGKSIAHDRDGIDPLRVPPGQGPETKHYGADYAAFTTGERDHHGLCDPVRDWFADGWNYYYVVCNVRFSDGTYERQSVPWPVRFDPKDDPFTGTSHGDEPLAMPLPGWHLPPGETVTVELREYAKSHGVDL